MDGHESEIGLNVILLPVPKLDQCPQGKNLGPHFPLQRSFFGVSGLLVFVASESLNIP